MRPRFYPSLVNGRTGDPALYVDLAMERRALLFDIGDIAALPARSVLRLTDVFVSHAHIDHFYGFDLLLRLLVGRVKCDNQDENGATIRMRAFRRCRTAGRA